MSVTQEYRSEQGERVVKADRRYRLRVEDAGGGLLRLVPSEAAYSPQEAMRILEPLDTLLIDREGAFQRTQSSEDELVDRLSQILPQGPQEKVQLQMELHTVSENMARQAWEQRVGRWRGRVLTVGKPARRPVKMGLGSTLGRREVDAEQVVTLEPDVACTAQDRLKKCVRLVEEQQSLKPSFPQEDARSPSDEPSQDRSGPRSVSAQCRTEWVLAPDSLWLYSFKVSRVDVIERAREDGTVSSEETRQMETLSFTYGPPPKPVRSTRFPW